MFDYIYIKDKPLYRRYKLTIIYNTIQAKLTKLLLINLIGRDNEMNVRITVNHFIRKTCKREPLLQRRSQTLI